MRAKAGVGGIENAQFRGATREIELNLGHPEIKL
jgi:hypothetical protein